MAMASIPPSAFRQPPRRRSDGGDSDMQSEEGGNTSILGGKCVFSKSRIRPYNVYVRRCKKARATNIDSLPDELLFHILVLLPADCLYDIARLICHRWYRIIHSHDFINTQIKHSTYGLLLSSFVNRGSHPIFIYVTGAQGRVETCELSYKCRNFILASCCGLAIESHHDDKGKFRLHVINPATKQPFLLPPLPNPNRVIYLRYRCRIAYSAVSMECKVTVPLLEHPGLEILTVGVDKSWRHVEVDHLPKHVKRFLFQSPFSTEGFLHRGRERNVLTMNVETEILTVSEVPLPPQAYKKGDYYYLSTGRYLSVVVRHGDLSWEVWEMKPESEEWRKLLREIDLEAQKRRIQQFTFGHCEHLSPCGWVKYPEVLAFCYLGKGRTCVFYNLDTHETNTIELPEFCYSYKHHVHQNNLVWSN